MMILELNPSLIIKPIKIEYLPHKTNESSLHEKQTPHIKNEGNRVFEKVYSKGKV